MNRLELRLGELAITLNLIEHQVEEAGKPYLDWLIFDVSVSVRSFSGRFRWQVMPGELLELAEGLADLHTAFPRPGSFSFKPTEPNVVLHFSLAKTGLLGVEYAFSDELHLEPGFQGTVGVDQSYLPGLVQEIRSFMREVERAV